MKNLTARYSGTHFFYWTAYSATSFAAAYLLEKGMNAGTIGLLLGLVLPHLVPSRKRKDRWMN